MKFSAVAPLCLAPLAMAGMLNAEIYPRQGHHANGALIPRAKGDAKTTTLGNGNKITAVSEEIIIIWINNGAGATTSTVNAQTSATTAGTAVAAATHQVTVGGTAGLVYTPNTINAAVGDVVVFTFLSQNHTVTQSAFTTPCESLVGGIDSGFMANANNSVTPAPQMAMQVTVSTPIWMYCAQKGHCGKGMTFSINPTTTKTQAMFESMAIAQNGTGTASGITGGSTTTAAAAAAASTGSIVTGTGTVTDGQCTCSCLCGAAAFPAAAIQGVSAFGGVAGSIPMSAMEKKRR